MEEDYFSPLDNLRRFLEKDNLLAAFPEGRSDMDEDIIIAEDWEFFSSLFDSFPLNFTKLVINYFTDYVLEKRQFPYVSDFLLEQIETEDEEFFVRLLEKLPKENTFGFTSFLLLQSRKEIEFLFLMQRLGFPVFSSNFIDMLIRRIDREIKREEETMMDLREDFFMEEGVDHPFVDYYTIESDTKKSLVEILSRDDVVLQNEDYFRELEIMPDDIIFLLLNKGASIREASTFMKIMKTHDFTEIINNSLHYPPMEVMVEIAYELMKSRDEETLRMIIPLIDTSLVVGGSNFLFEYFHSTNLGREVNDFDKLVLTNVRDWEISVLSSSPSYDRYYDSIFTILYSRIFPDNSTLLEMDRMWRQNYDRENVNSFIYWLRVLKDYGADLNLIRCGGANKHRIISRFLTDDFDGDFVMEMIDEFPELLDYPPLFDNDDITELIIDEIVYRRYSQRYFNHHGMIEQYGFNDQVFERINVTNFPTSVFFRRDIMDWEPQPFIMDSILARLFRITCEDFFYGPKRSLANQYMNGLLLKLIYLMYYRLGIKNYGDETVDGGKAVFFGASVEDWDDLIFRYANDEELASYEIYRDAFLEDPQYPYTFVFPRLPMLTAEERESILEGIIPNPYYQ